MNRTVSASAILRLTTELPDQDCYGFNLAAQADISVNGAYKLLDSLRRHGLLLRYEEAQSNPLTGARLGRRPRVLYKITPAGRAQLAAWERETLSRRETVKARALRRVLS